MDTYTTLAGQVLDLTHLTDTERAFFRRCYEAFKANMAWADFANLAERSENPLIAATGGWITREVRRHPLYQAVRDLEDRLGIKQGKLAPALGSDLDQDPVADEWISPSEAARRKGVTAPGLHRAISRGDVIAKPARPDGSWRLVSVNSLERWTPMAARQASGRAGGLASQGRG